MEGERGKGAGGRDWRGSGAGVYSGAGGREVGEGRGGENLIFHKRLGQYAPNFFTIMGTEVPHPTGNANPSSYQVSAVR